MFKKFFSAYIGSYGSSQKRAKYFKILSHNSPPVRIHAIFVGCDFCDFVKLILFSPKKREGTQSFNSNVDNIVSSCRVICTHALIFHIRINMFRSIDKSIVVNARYCCI